MQDLKTQIKVALNITRDDINFLSALFVEKYFGKNIWAQNIWWVDDEIGSVLHINDYYFSLKYIIDFLEYKYTRKQMFEYYYYVLNLEEKTPICIRDWNKLK